MAEHRGDNSTLGTEMEWLKTYSYLNKHIENRYTRTKIDMVI